MKKKHYTKLNKTLFTLFEEVRDDKTTLEIARVQVRISNQIIKLEATKIKSERIIGHTDAFFK
jgi:hypothetical protein